MYINILKQHRRITYASYRFEKEPQAASFHRWDECERSKSEKYEANNQKIQKTIKPQKAHYEQTHMHRIPQEGLTHSNKYILMDRDGILNSL